MGFEIKRTTEYQNAVSRPFLKKRIDIISEVGNLLFVQFFSSYYNDTNVEPSKLTNIDSGMKIDGTINGDFVGYSDDRLKMNEKNISDTSPLLKLRPQVYNKLKEIGGDTNNARFESGLIAQEIWYDCPELRHLVHVGAGGEPADDIKTSDDPTVDPDYSSWGSEPASVNYVGFIPYLIRGFQEHHEEVDALKKENAEMKAQIAMLMKACGLVDSGNVDSA